MTKLLNTRVTILHYTHNTRVTTLCVSNGRVKVKNFETAWLLLFVDLYSPPVDRVKLYHKNVVFVIHKIH